jgi:hypothetical protein
MFLLDQGGPTSGARKGDGEWAARLSRPDDDRIVLS